MSLLSNFIKVLTIPLHAFTHQNGGTDEVNVAGLSGELADPQTPKTHATSHQNGGGDEVSVTGLSGLLADGQTPLSHATSHKSGGGDSIKLDELAAPTDVTTLNASTSAHGLLKKLNNVSTNFMNGQGNWATPSSTPPSSSVGTSQLKTTYGDIYGTGTYNAPGGAYGFYPQLKAVVADQNASVHILDNYIYLLTTTFQTKISIVGASPIYVRQRYVTASGTDMWLFLMRQKYTGALVSGWSAPDHPSVNQDLTFDELPHPFFSYDPDIHEIFVVAKSKVQELQAQLVGTQGVLELALTLEVGEEVAYVPLHSGRYINGQPEMVNTLPAYIKCRTLIGSSSSSSSA